MLKNSIVLLSTLLLFAGCSSESGKKETTLGGYEYIHHLSNEGPKPQAGDYVFFQVLMSNGDSITFNSYGQKTMPRAIIPDPSNPQASQSSPVLDALALMSIGDSLTLYYPIDSLKGTPPPGYEKSDNIIYELALKRILTAAEFQAEAKADQDKLTARLDDVRASTQNLIERYRNGQVGEEELQSTPEGLRYIIHEQGSGPAPKLGDMVVAQYYGALVDGTEFDNSYARGRPFNFPLGQGRVIPGWDLGFSLLNQGGKATFFVPASLGYGAAGSPPKIPGGAELVFYVELEEVR